MNLNEGYVQLELSLMFQCFNLVEQCIHSLRNQSCLATIFEASSHCICFT